MLNCGGSDKVGRASTEDMDSGEGSSVLVSDGISIGGGRFRRSEGGGGKG